MKELYLEVYSDVDLNGEVSVPLETLIVLVAFKFCEHPPILVTFVKGRCDTIPAFKVKVDNILFENISVQDVAAPADLCKFPVVVMHEGTTCVAGLCAVIRHIFKTTDLFHSFLGFKQSCLYACAEASLWTKFCEVDGPKTVKELMNMNQSTGFVGILEDLARFETHLAQPVRAHNIQKVKQDMARAAGSSRRGLPDSRLQMTCELEHIFAEGATPSLADVILFPCFHIAFNLLPELKQLLPLTRAWYEKVHKVDMIDEAVNIVLCPGKKKLNEDLVLPKVPAESLYKSDPRRYKPRHKIFTRQDDIETSMGIVTDLSLDMISNEPFGYDVDFDWESVPWDAQPEGGSLPPKRIQRKSQQLENLVRAVLKIAKQGDRIVDFCAGSGHLGLILAHSLPRCTVVLLENKEESLGRARLRAKKLHLSNIHFCQSNVDYFTGCFDIGVSLHACGVATDLVMDTCLRRRAAFVCCPCCYGSMQPNHVVCYPRSEKFRSLPLSQREYLVLGHAADQTHDDDSWKTEQGKRCMNVIDGDRCWNAREAGYWVSLSKLLPPSCTPKNNLLIGVPPVENI